MCRAIHIAILLACISIAAYPLRAQPLAYPSKLVRIIVPTAPGGGVDILSRLVGQKLAESLGQPFVVDNRGGAAGNLGAAIAAKAAPDGYTLLMTPSAISISAALYPSLQYDGRRDFVPVSILASTPYFVLTHPSVPASSLKPLIAFARAHPGQLNYSSAGAGSASHLAMEMLKRAARIDIVHVPFKGVGPAMTALLSGEVSLMVAGYPPSAAHIKAGRIRALAIADAKRSAFMPALPTVAEAGYPGYAVENWVGLMVPAGTPAAIVNRLASEVTALIRRPEMKEQLAAEIMKWKRVVSETGVRADS